MTLESWLLTACKHGCILKLDFYSGFRVPRVVSLRVRAGTGQERRENFCMLGYTVSNVPTNRML